MGRERRYPGETDGILTPAEFDQVLLWAREAGASDVKVAPDRPGWARFDGEWHPIMRRALQNEELVAILNHTARTHAAFGHLSAGGGDYDYHYAIRAGRADLVRFRANATACNYGAQTGVEITFRTITPLPPSPQEIGVPEDLTLACMPVNGLVLVTGTMGSGKSTTIAAILRRILETQRRSVATYEAPIEYDLAGVVNLGPVAQSEIPRQFPSFDRAARNSTRRASDVILIGEMRDRETMRSGIELAEIGSTVYGTVHTMSVASTLPRMLGVFDKSEWRQVAATLASAIRVIVHQRLVPGAEGGRTALREWLICERAMRETLAATQIERMGGQIQEWVERTGHTLLADAREAAQAGRIAESYLTRIEAEMQEHSDVRA